MEIRIELSKQEVETLRRHYALTEATPGLPPILLQNAVKTIVTDAISVITSST